MSEHICLEEELGNSSITYYMPLGVLSLKGFHVTFWVHLFLKREPGCPLQSKKVCAVPRRLPQRTEGLH